MEKTFKKVLAVMLSIAMILTSISVSDFTVKADVTDDINNASINLALGKSVSYLHMHSDGAGTTADKVTDGSLTTQQFAVNAVTDNWGGEAGETYVVIDLGDYYDASSINQIFIAYKNADANDTVLTRSYSVLYSADGVQYNITAVDNKTVTAFDDTDHNATIDDVSTVTGTVRYVKVHYPKTANYGMQLKEVAVLAPNAQTVTVEACDDAEDVTVTSDAFNEISYTVVAGEGQEGYVYNVFLDGNQVGTAVAAGQKYTVSNVEGGEHTVSVIAAYNGKVSKGISKQVTVKDVSSLITSDRDIAYTGTNANAKIIEPIAMWDASYTIDSVQGALNGSKLTNTGDEAPIRTAGGSSEATIYLDLGAGYTAKEIEKIMLVAPHDRINPTTFTVDFSTDNATWNTVGTYTNVSYSAYNGALIFIGDLDTTNYPSEQARYVKLHITGGGNGGTYGYGINEIGIIVGDDSENVEDPTEVETPTNEETTTVEETTATPETTTIAPETTTVENPTDNNGENSVTYTYTIAQNEAGKVFPDTNENGNNYVRYDGITASASNGDASQAIDNNGGSRWESEHGVDPQYITVDLKKTYSVKEIDASWEAANAKDYTVQVSTDGEKYTTVATVADAVGGERVDKIVLGNAVTARYVRIHGTARNNVYGYSVWEIAIYGPDAAQQIVKAPTDLYVENYGKYTGKYFAVFTPADGATSYNIYVDGKLVKNVKGSGYYITSEELEALNITNGTYTLSVTSVGADGEESEGLTGEITVEDRGNNDDIPQVYISTQNRNIDGTYFKKKDGKITVNVAIVDNSGTYKDIIDAASDIKVRGNTTAGAEKKPYNIKLGKKQAPLGMDSAKKWSFLANAFDKSLVRNALVMELAHEMGLAYTSDCRFVDIYCNGEYLGNYLMIESVETGKGRIEIDAEDTTNTDILLELDNTGRDVYEAYHLDRTDLEVYLMLNEPEIEPNDTDMIETYQDKINKTNQLLADFEAALKANDFEAIQQYIDIDSFAKFYIVNELIENQDFDYSSTRFYVKDGKLYAGPCWDYDLSSGNLGTYYGDSVGMGAVEKYKAKEMKWYEYLMNNEEFRAYVTNVYEQYVPNIKGIYTTYLDSLVEKYGASFERNYTSKDALGAGWSVKEPDQGDFLSYATSRPWDTYEDTITYLKQWLSQRHIWLENQWDVDDPTIPCSLINDDGAITVRWNYEGTKTVDHYEISYTNYDINAKQATGTKTVNAAADATSTVITDVIDNDTTVTVTAVFTDGTNAVVGTAKALADLKITDIYFVDSATGTKVERPAEGMQVKGCLEVTNIGTAVAYPAIGSIPSNIYVDGTSIGWTDAYQEPFAPNQVADYQFASGDWTVQSGEHIISAVIDDRNQVTEKNENNNITTIKFTFDNNVSRPIGVATDIVDGQPKVIITESAEQAADGYTYDIYIDGNYYTNVTAAGTYDLGDLAVGTHTVTVYSRSGNETSLGVSAKITIEEETTEEATTEPQTQEGPATYTKSIVAFEYSNVGKSAGDDVTEYAYEENDYTYFATTGTGTFKASVTGLALKHLEWSSDVFKDVAGNTIGISPIVKASKSNNWTSDLYLEYDFSTTGYTDMTLSVDVGATNKGPANLKVVYYDAEGTEQVIGEIHNTTGKVLTTYSFEIPTALENQENVSIYIKLTDTTTVAGLDLSANPSSGNLAVNNFKITVETDEEPEETTTEEPTTEEQTTEPETEPVPVTYDNSIVEFKYDSTGVTGDTDMNEYAYNYDTYTYYATAGIGTMTASVNGQNLKHVEWSKDATDYKAVVPLVAASKTEPNVWSADAYVAYAFSTTGYTGLKGTVNVGGSKKGPKNLLIGYYDGDEFVTITEYSIAKNKTIYTIDFELPQALEDKENVTIYVKLKDTTNIGGNEMTSDAYKNGGELMINNFVIYQTSETEQSLLDNVSRIQTSSTATTVSATWTVPEGLSSNVYVYDSEGKLVETQENVTEYSKDGLAPGTEYTLKITTTDGTTETAGIDAKLATTSVTADLAVTGYQMSTTLGDNNDGIGFRVIYQKEQTVEAQNITEIGLVYALVRDGVELTDDEIVVGSDDDYIADKKATDAGKMSVAFGDSDTAEYYAMTMQIPESAYNRDYKVRVYAVLEDGTTVYSEVKEYNVYKVASELYQSNRMNSSEAHEALYDKVISQVNPEAEKVDYNWNQIFVNQPETTGENLNIEGFQMGANINDEEGVMGIRTVYSAEGEYEEVGLIYGVERGSNTLSADDLTIDYTSKYVAKSTATEAGKMSVKLDETKSANYYSMTMKLPTTMAAKYYQETYKVRAYAKTADGEYVYSDVSSYTIKDVAETLYQNSLMSTYAGHEALYNNILLKINADYEEIDYNWANNIIK